MNSLSHGGDIFSQPIELDFSVNINPFGMPEEVKQAIISGLDRYESYPDPLSRELREKIAVAEAINKENIICGNGAADLIYRFCLVMRPKRVLLCAPTFSDYARAAKLAGAKIIEHQLKESNNFALREDILTEIKEDIDLLFLCNPNNPDGLLLADDLLAKIIERTDKTNTLLLLDECFLPFTEGKSLTEKINEFKHLFVLKAFTKIYAMAGIRLGYLISGNLDILTKISEFGQSWSVSAVAQQAGLAAIVKREKLSDLCTYLRGERERMQLALNNMGIKTYPSAANFFLIQSKIRLYDHLLKEKILIRSCANFSGLDGNYFRLAIKRREENDILLAAIEKIVRKQQE